MAKTFDEYMAETGRQGELDELRRTFKYDEAKRAYESGGMDYQVNVDRLNQNTDAYFNELLDGYQGRLDLVIKQIDQAHETALGNNDTETAKFLEKVADAAEARMGRIPYDYEKFTGRENTDYSTAMSRLKEDQQLLLKDFNEKSALARQDQGTSLNQRGILNNTRERAVGLAGQEVGRLEDEISSRMDALERQYNRATSDQTLAHNRNLEDITTGSRRSAIDTQNQLSSQREGAIFDFEQQKKELDRKKELEKQRNQAAGFSLLA